VNLERVSAVIRPRSDWEAIDLGMTLTKAHYGLMLKSSLLLTLPLFVLLHLMAVGASEWMDLRWAGLIFWWLKPIWERSHLHVLSRCLFGDAPSVKETVQGFPGYALSGMLRWLTIWRFRPTRGLDMPVTQLEGLSGKAGARRLRLLRRGTVGTGAGWHLIVMAHLEIFLAISIVAVAAVFVPPNVDFDLLSWVRGEGSEVWIDFVNNLLAYVAAVLLAPFFVGGGFGLYINRRIILEGWDLEIAFRRLAERIAQEGASESVKASARGRSGSVLALLLCMAVFVTGAPGPASAADEVEGVDAAVVERLDQGSARRAIEEVLEGEVFHQKKTLSVPQLVEALRAEPSADDSWLVSVLKALLKWFRGDKKQPESNFNWLMGVFDGIALVIEIVLVAAGLGVVLYIVHRYRGGLVGGKHRLNPQRSMPRTLMGMEVSRESLPSEVADSVRSLVAAERYREAVALLYRASLVGLMEKYGAEFHASMTERDCMRVATASAQQACAEFFVGLTRQWQFAAYAQRPPNAQSVLALCQDWSRFFDESDARDVGHNVEATRGNADG
jgi:hypothetical protein